MSPRKADRGRHSAGRMTRLERVSSPSAMAVAAAAGVILRSMALGSVPSSSSTIGSSSTPRAIMSVCTSEKYAVRTETSWSASSTRSPRPSCSTAALLMA